MRVQLIVSLALLQLHSFAAAAATVNKGSNTMVDASGNQGTAMSPSGHSNHGSNHDSKPQGDHKAGKNSGQGGAGSGHGSNQKAKGLPRAVDFPGIHISPVSGGVVIPADSATWDKRAMSSAVSSPSSGYSSENDCEGFLNLPRGSVPKRCVGFIPLSTVPDPIPAGCATHGTYASYGRRSIAEEGSATSDAISAPSSWSSLVPDDCPFVDRRGGFLVRRCSRLDRINSEIMDTAPVSAEAKKRAPAAKEVWTRSDGGESYFECGGLDGNGDFIAKRCPEEEPGAITSPFNLDTIAKRFYPAATSNKKRASTTQGFGAISSGLPTLMNECGMMGRDNLLVRFVCCDTQCNVDIPTIDPSSSLLATSQVLD